MHTIIYEWELGDNIGSMLDFRSKNGGKIIKIFWSF
jgi:hypothetical protein